MRLFVAVDPDAPSRDALADVQQRVTRRLASDTTLRWVRPEHLHLTLVFLGEITESAAAAVIPAAGEPVAQAAFDLSFAGFGAFPPRGAPRALWIGVTEGAASLIALQQEMAARMARLEIPLEARSFSPHLTLARWKSSRPSDRGRALAAPPGGPIARMRVDAAVLYHSRLSSAGPSYTELARARLNG
jgi:2'-5' RNA ligase